MLAQARFPSESRGTMVRRYLALTLVMAVGLAAFVMPWSQGAPASTAGSGDMFSVPIAQAASCGADATYTCTEMPGRPYIQGTTDIGVHGSLNPGFGQAVQVNLPFTFNYYGVNHTTINVEAIGLAEFDSASLLFAQPFPVQPMYTVIAPFWDSNLCTDDDCWGGRGDGGNGV